MNHSNHLLLYRLNSTAFGLMKTTMKIFGNVSLAMLGIATMFKIMHWPGGSLMLTLGFFLLAFIFFPATILASYRKSEKKRPGV